MVVSGGVNIYPAEAEQALQRHPAVADVACIGVDDAEMGERLIGLVQLAGVGHDVDAVTTELLQWCRESLAGYKCPKQLHVVTEIPRNSMGKVDKKALRTRYAQG
jgi:acyl-CoA synthetase (AMP-forming)/AMP-acid ligase II